MPRLQVAVKANAATIPPSLLAAHFVNRVKNDLNHVIDVEFVDAAALDDGESVALSLRDGEDALGALRVLSALQTCLGPSHQSSFEHVSIAPA